MLCEPSHYVFEADVSLVCLHRSVLNHGGLAIHIYTPLSLVIIGSVMTGHLIGVKPLLPDSEVYGANMGPIWGRQDPGGPHVGPMNLAIWACINANLLSTRPQRIRDQNEIIFIN